MKRIIGFTIPLLFVLAIGVPGRGAAAAGSQIFLPMIRQSVPELGAIDGPLLVDGEHGRIYTQAEVNGVPRTVALTTANGALLQVFMPTGRLALDRTRQHLIIDGGDAGVTILDGISGAILESLSIPGKAVADPQIDPGRERGFVFRKSTIHVLDLSARTESGTMELPGWLSVCGDPQGSPPITRSFYEPAAGVLFVSATTYVCTPFLQETIFSYDDNLLPSGQSDYSRPYQAVAYAGNLYGSSVLRGYQPFGLSYWALNATEAWYEETVVGSDAMLKGIVVDEQRNLLYEAIWEYPAQGETERMVRVSSTGARDLRHTVPWSRLGLGDARLAGHDAYGDQLYFVEDGVLHVVPTSVLLAE